jgi:hypothetical protein
MHLNISMVAHYNSFMPQLTHIKTKKNFLKNPPSVLN